MAYELDLKITEGINAPKVVNYEGAVQIVDDYLKTAPNIDTISNDAELDTVATFRTDLRKRVESISTFRKNKEKEILGTFKSQLMSIEKKLTAVDDDLKAKVASYKKAKEDALPKTEEASIFFAKDVRLVSLNKDDLDAIIDTVKKACDKKGIKIIISDVEVK